MEGQSLKDKVAVVTGASSGIGQAIAVALARNGVKVGLLARRLNRLQVLQKEITCNGGEALAVECDVTDRKQVFEAVAKVRQSMGNIDILVNNAGIANATFLSKVDIQAWLQVVDVNIIGTLHCYAAILQDMINRGSGHIINISSIQGRSSLPTMAAYAGSKHFMQGHSAGMRKELASLGIKVTILQPGATKTEIIDGSSYDAQVAQFLSSMPLFQKMSTEPIMESEDVAEAAIFALTQPDRVGVNEIMMEPKTIVFNST